MHDDVHRTLGPPSHQFGDFRRKRYSAREDCPLIEDDRLFEAELRCASILMGKKSGVASGSKGVWLSVIGCGHRCSDRAERDPAHFLQQSSRGVRLVGFAPTSPRRRLPNYASPAPYRTTAACFDFSQAWF